MSAPKPQIEKHVLAIASAGGHWHQLMALRPAFDGHRVSYLTTMEGLASEFGVEPSWLVPDCNRDQPVAALKSFVSISRRMISLRPDMVISTGALPGVMALAIGRLLGAKCVWVDSIANAEELSASGRLAKRFAHLHLSQWEAVATAEGSEYAGALL